MEILVPTLQISIEDPTYRILSLTLNPIFGSRLTWPILQPVPARKIEVWLEIMLGLEDTSHRPVELPRIRFEFSSAFGFNGDEVPIETDVIGRQSRKNLKQIRSLTGLTRNYVMYRHFWYNRTLQAQNRHGTEDDQLSAAYGDSAKRVVRDNSDPETMKFDPVVDVRSQASLAFYRSPSYRVLPAKPGAEHQSRISADLLDQFGRELEMSRLVAHPLGDGSRNIRLNYPCSFTVEKYDRESRSYVVIPRPFSSEVDHMPVPDKSFEIHGYESISFWYHYPYPMSTAAAAADPENDLFAFRQKTVVASGALSQTKIHSFPRMSFRYQVWNSCPQMVPSPRLPADPGYWQSGEKKYPLMSDDSFDFEHDTDSGQSYLYLSTSLRDTKYGTDKELTTVFCILMIGVLIDPVVDLLVNSEDLMNTAHRCLIAGTLALVAYAIFINWSNLRVFRLVLPWLARLFPEKTEDL